MGARIATSERVCARSTLDHDDEFLSTDVD